MKRSTEYQAPAVDSFEDSEILGEAPQSTGTEIAGSHVEFHEV